MSPNISASKSPLRNCVRSSRDGQFSSQPNTTERGTASLRYPIIKQQQATNAEMIINLKTAKMLNKTANLARQSAAAGMRLSLNYQKHRIRPCQQLARNGPQAMSVLSPHSGPKRKTSALSGYFAF